MTIHSTWKPPDIRCPEKSTKLTMKVFKSLDGDMIKNSFKDMFVILNALKYLYFKEFFSTFLFLYFFSTHVKEHVDNLIASSDYFTRLLNENV